MTEGGELPLTIRQRAFALGGDGWLTNRGRERAKAELLQKKKKVK